MAGRSPRSARRARDRIVAGVCRRARSLAVAVPALHRHRVARAPLRTRHRDRAQLGNRAEQHADRLPLHHLCSRRRRRALLFCRTTKSRRHRLYHRRVAGRVDDRLRPSSQPQTQRSIAREHRAIERARVRGERARHRARDATAPPAAATDRARRIPRHGAHARRAHRRRRLLRRTAPLRRPDRDHRRRRVGKRESPRA